VLVTGGAGAIGTAVARRLVRDPVWEVRVSDQRKPPAELREAAEVHRGDLRDLGDAREAMLGCTHVVHLAAIVGGIANFHKLPHTLLEVNNGLYNAVFRAALEQRVERLVYVSSSMVFERATEFPRRTWPTVPHRGRRTASPSSPARSTAGRSTRSTASHSRSAGPSTPTAPGSCRTTSRESRTWSPT
jgi:nucleoside-diphosphate-sugar epimerase